MKMILSSPNLVRKTGITSEENRESKLTIEENLFFAYRNESGTFLHAES
jgi:hypothetical protein